MSDSFEAALRSRLRDAALDWTPLESPAAIGDRLFRRIRARRRRRATTAAGAVLAGLAAVLLVGQVVAAPQVVRQVATGPQTTSISHPTDSTTALTGPAGACYFDCVGDPGSSTVATTTATTWAGRVARGGVPPRHTYPRTHVTSRITLPITTEPPVSLPGTTLPPPPPTTGVPPTTVTTSPPPPQVYTLTAADFGKTVEVRAGDEIVVDLTPCPGGAWSPVSVSDPSVLVRQAPPTTVVPPPGTALAEYRAATAGQSRITARQHSTCAATPTVAFAVTIVVT